jgi:hypothetical protein
MRFTDYLRGARALWRCTGAGRVDLNTAANRATHCANCPWLAQDGGLLVRLVSWAYERLFPPYGLGEPWRSRQAWACRLCRCAIRVKARLPLPFILRHTPTDLYDRFPREICWIKTESGQLDAPPPKAQE